MLSLAPENGEGLAITADPDSQRRLLGLDARYRQLSDGPYVGRVAWVRRGSVQIVRESQNRALSKEVALPAGACTISYLWGDRTVARLGDRSLPANTIGHCPAGAEMDFQTPAGLGATFFVFERAAFARAAEAFAASLWARPPRAPTAHATRSLPALVALEAELRHGDGIATRLSGPQIEALCLSTVLETYHDTDGTAPSAPISSRRAYQVTRAARALIDAGMGEPMTVLDLCRGVGASRKTLQAAFNAVLGMGPARYLRLARLNHARSALVRAEAGRDLVSDIAFASGFWHMSKFAQDYRAAFGELPSETLARPERRFQAVGS